MRHVTALMLVAALAVTSTGCFAITDIDNFESAAGRDFVLHLRGMIPHRSQRVEITLLDQAGNLQSWARIRPLGSEDYDLVMPKAMAVPPYRVDFYADAMEDGLDDFTPPATPVDHQWRIDPYPLSGEYTFAHNTNFLRISPTASGSGDAVATFTGIPMSGIDQRAEVRVLEAANGRTRVLIRQQSVPGATMMLSAPGVFELETNYQVDAWIDINHNGRYDPPGADGDLSYRQTINTMGVAAVTAAFDFSSADTVDVGF